MSALLGNKVILLIIIAAVSVTAVVIITQSDSGTKFYNPLNKDYYLELNDDGTFFLKDLNMNVSGRYEISGSTITLKPGQGLSTKKGRIEGNIITDPDGEKWIRQ